jgi:RNA polymerase sigma factor (sigma-70 family)
MKHMIDARANDTDLLTAYAQARSQRAFTHLVERHIDMVHATARRMLGDAHLADDATQAVFLLLSRRAGHLRHASVAGWLYLATTYTVRNMQRAKRRQQQREQAAATVVRDRTMGSHREIDIDSALARLRPAEREVLVFRYMRSMSVAEVAAVGMESTRNAAGTIRTDDPGPQHAATEGEGFAAMNTTDA